MITSIKNETVKRWMKLHKKKYRERYGQFLLEGDHLVEEAIKSDWEVSELIIREDRDIHTWQNDYRITVVNHQVFQALTETPAPQGVMAVINMKDNVINTLKKLLVLDNVQDPGNVGTMIRTADAFNYDGVILGKGTVDLFNDKVIRATQGSLFHIPVIKRDLRTLLPELKQNGLTIIASTLEESVPLNHIDPMDNFAIIVGNEGSGIAQDIQELSDIRVKIPIPGQAESLNVSIAAAIVMYHCQ